jgi:hypothetical protein
MTSDRPAEPSGKLSHRFFRSKKPEPLDSVQLRSERGYGKSRKMDDFRNYREYLCGRCAERGWRGVEEKGNSFRLSEAPKP